MKQEMSKVLPNPLSLRIVLHSLCNFNCKFCHKEGTCSLKPIPLDTIKKMLVFFKGKIKRVVFTGGEPTLYPELREAVKMAKENGYKVGITTNGSRIAEEVFDLVDEIHISLTTIDEDKFTDLTGYKDFNKIINNIREVNSRWKDKLRINKVVFPYELKNNSLNHYIDFIKSLGIKALSLFSVVSSNKINSLSLTGEIINYIKKTYNLVEDTPRYTLFKENSFSLIVKKIMLSEMCNSCPLKHICEGKCGIRLLPDGFLDVCLYKMYTPIDIMDKSFNSISPEEVIDYYYKGKLPKQLKKNEYEIKYEVKRKDSLNSLHVVYKEKASLVVDEYWEIGDLKPSIYYLRFREKNKKKSFDFHVVKDDVLTQEYETELENFEPVKELLKHLGGRKLVTVKKERSHLIVNYNGENFKLVVDEVEGLGTFVEVEGLSPRYVAKISNYLGALHLGLAKITGKGYPDLILERGEELI